ncbi:hypothetical protein Taro_032179, partial [Colocasia esculenta]|nr:hypothetical protein [Colocasia esculenta]
MERSRTTGGAVRWCTPPVAQATGGVHHWWDSPVGPTVRRRTGCARGPHGMRAWAPRRPCARDLHGPVVHTIGGVPTGGIHHRDHCPVVYTTVASPWGARPLP